MLHLVRMDGASPANARIATEKGRTAAETRRSTAAWQERIKTRPDSTRSAQASDSDFATTGESLGQRDDAPVDQAFDLLR